MLKKTGKDIQLSFEFDSPDRKIRFIAVKCKCKCGYTGEFKKADIVLEMTVLCPKCKSVINLK